MSAKIYLADPDLWINMSDEEKAQAFTDAMHFAGELARNNEWLAAQLRQVSDLLDKVQKGSMTDDDFIDELNDLAIDWLPPDRYALIYGAK